MFELFGSDSDKKEEIDKNMDKIKDMVGSSSSTDRPSETQSPEQARQQGPPGSQRPSRQADEQDTTSSPAPVQAEGRQPPQGPGSPKGGSSGAQEPSSGPQQAQKSPNKPSQDRSTTAQGQERNRLTPQRPQSSSDSSSGQQDTGPEPSRQEESADRGVRQEPKPEEQSEPEPDKDESEPEPPKRQEIPEAPETKEIEVPEIEKGPLFIRVKKFKEAKKMIHEMQNLADDVETDMGGLQNTLEEDKDVQKDLKGRLKKLRDSMKSIHTIVSP